MPLRRLSDSRHTIGGMSKWITLYSPGPPGTDGGTTPPSPAISTWADIKALSGAELDKANQIAQEVEHIITIPYQSSVTAAMTAGYEDRMFQIKYIEDPDENRFFLDLYCAEIGQNAGQQT